MEAGNKKISVIIGVIVVIAIIAAGLIRNAKPKSRAELISELYGGEDYVICAEAAIDDYIINAAYGPNGKASLITFEPEGNGRYGIQSTVNRDISQIIMGMAVVDGNVYELIWFGGAETEYALVTCTDNVSGEENTVRYDAEVSDIIYFESPSDDFNMNIVYYDKEGNMYE